MHPVQPSIPANILPVSDCQLILEDCQTDRALLSWKLGFHYALKSALASRLVGEDFCWRHGVPVGLHLPRSPYGGRRDYWYMPIRRNDQLLLASLLPKRGPLFSTLTPYQNLCWRAARLGISLSSTQIQQTCLIYALASRCFHEHFLELAGLPRKWIFSPVPQSEALKFFALTKPKHRDVV